MITQIKAPDGGNESEVFASLFTEDPPFVVEIPASAYDQDMQVQVTPQTGRPVCEVVELPDGTLRFSEAVNKVTTSYSTEIDFGGISIKDSGTD